MNDDKHKPFQLLATKGDNEVVTAILDASTEYGTHNALPSYIGVLHPNRVHRHNIHLLSYKVFNHRIKTLYAVNLMWKFLVQMKVSWLLLN